MKPQAWKYSSYSLLMKIIIANGANNSLGALFDEGALILDSPMCDLLLEAGKTPTTSVQGVDLVATVDGGNWKGHLNSMSR